MVAINSSSPLKTQTWWLSLPLRQAASTVRQKMSSKNETRAGGE